MKRLSQQVAGGDRTALETFWEAVRREHTPIVQPIAADDKHVMATFVWRSEPGTRAVKVLGTEMTRIPGTELWFATFIADRALHFSYAFTPVKDEASGAPPAASPDPFNPHRFAAPVQQERPADADPEPEANRSIFFLPGATARAACESILRLVILPRRAAATICWSASTG